MAFEGTLTRDELVEEVNKNLGGRGSSEDPGSTRTIRHLDLAQLRIAREPYHWRELSDYTTFTNTFANDPTVDAFINIHTKITSRNLHKIYKLLLVAETVTDHALVRINPRQWDQILPDARSFSVAGSSQEMTHYIQWSDMLQIYRVPNAAYTWTVRYSFWPARLTSGSQKSNFANKDDMVISLATHSLFQSLGAGEDAIRWFSIYRDLLDAASKDAGYEPDLATQALGPLEDAGSMSPHDYWNDPFYKGY